MKDKRGQIIGRVPITERPAIVEEKSRMGDLEIDLINSSDHDCNLLTINDRMTNMCILRRLPTKDAEIARALSVDYYFAKPYHSWERGANENMNGLIRQYLPKKRLDFLTPLEYICKQVKLN